MRRALLAVAVVGLLVQSGAAKEIEGNPDRLPSIGLNYQRLSTDGDITYTSAGATAIQNSDTKTGALIFDGRLPINNSLTLNAAFGLASNEANVSETSLLNGGKLDEDGTFINVGLRFYIH